MPKAGAKSYPKAFARAAAILIEDGKIALIERRREGNLYYVFPGGQVEYGEWPTETVAREVEEELGLRVQVKRLVAEVIYGNKQQYYFLVERTGGKFGTGKGEEMSNLPESEGGSYTPVWIPIAALNKLTVYPLPVLKLVRKAESDGWPDKPLRFYESKRS